METGSSEASSSALQVNASEGDILQQALKNIGLSQSKEQMHILKDGKGLTNHDLCCILHAGCGCSLLQASCQLSGQTEIDVLRLMYLLVIAMS